MSKLDDYIKGGPFPIVRTGISNDDFVVKTWKRKADNLVYKCSFCDCDINPTDWMHTHTERGYTVPREGFLGLIRNEFEVLGYVCNKCNDEITEYDNLYYG